MALLGAKGVLKMIVSHRARSSLNMSSYGAKRTYFTPNPMIFSKKNVVVLNQALVQDLVQVLVQDLVQVQDLLQDLVHVLVQVLVRREQKHKEKKQGGHHQVIGHVYISLVR